MSNDMYIGFDNYYDVKEYNSFKNAAKNNNIEFEEYIRIRAPFNRFLKISDKRDLPSFVNFDYASVSDIKWLVSSIKAVRPNEEYLLRRREGKDVSYWNYILPKPLQNAHKKEYIMVFKAMDFTEMIQYSRALGNTKIYKWGKSEKKGYDIYYCFNPYIKGLIPLSKVLMEFGPGADSGLKKDTVMPKTPGDLEYYLNTFVLVKEKLENKTFEALYFQNGKIYPLKKDTFI